MFRDRQVFFEPLKIALFQPQLKPWQLKAVEKGFNNAFDVGPVLGYSVVSCKFTIQNIAIGRGTSETMIASAIVSAVQVIVLTRPTDSQVFEARQVLAFFLFLLSFTGGVSINRSLKEELCVVKAKNGCLAGLPGRKSLDWVKN